MKFDVYVILVLVCFTSTFSFASKVNTRKFNSIARDTSATKYDFENPVANFFYKAVLSFFSLDDDKIKKCIDGVSNKIKSGGDPRPDKDKKEDSKEVEEKQSWFSKVIDIGTKIIGFVCDWKTALFNFITSIFEEKRFRRRNRLFFEGKSKVSAKWCFITCWIKSTYTKFMDMAKKSGNKVVGAFSPVKEAFKSGMDKILDFTSSTIVKVITFYNTYIKSYASIIATCASVGVSIANAIANIGTTLALYSSGVAGVATILKNIICAAEDIVEMLRSIWSAFKETNVGKKWGLFGKAFGIIVKVVLGATSARRLRRNRRFL